MTLIEIFEKVNLVTPIEQRRFFNYLEDSVNELHALYGKCIFAAGTENFIPPKELSDSIDILPLYRNAIVDNIIFLAGGQDIYKSEFIRKSRDAYLKYWSDNAKGKRMKRARW